VFRTILLCYDGSREGRNALRQGADVALAMRSRAYLLGIVRGSGVRPPEGVSETAATSEDEAAQAILREGVEWLRAHGVHAEGRLVSGDPLAEIAACARAIGADLIVVGHRRRGRLARWWSDSEEATLLDDAPCSILAACDPG
jgi:nucleotide-binding universal stress UspA family protein